MYYSSNTMFYDLMTLINYFLGLTNHKDANLNKIGLQSSSLALPKKNSSSLARRSWKLLIL